MNLFYSHLLPSSPPLLLTFALLFATPATAEEPDCIFPYICPIAGRVMPEVGQRGTEVKVLLQGAQLERLEDLLFYGSGIRFVDFELVDEVRRDRLDVTQKTPHGTGGILTLDIADNCPLGEHKFRIKTTDALSEMLTFWVTPWPVIAEEHPGHDSPKETNGDFDHAQPVKLGTSLSGYHPEYSTMDYDFYSVQLQKGQRLTVEIWSACLGFEHHRGLTDIAITVYGPDKKKIAYEDDSSLRAMDPILSLIAPEAGTYYINIHQNMDFEGSLRHYVAHISDCARPRITYPLGGEAGTTLPLTLIGDPAGDINADFQLPDSTGRFEQSMIDYRGPWSAPPVIPMKLQVADFRNVLESEGDHSQPESAQVVEGDLPLALNGRILDEGKTDWFRITAKKGERYKVRTYAATLGSSLDATLIIRPADGTNSRINIEADDSKWIDHDWWGNDKVWMQQGRMDPVAVFAPDADGDYLIGIRDAQRLYGPDYVYRVEFQPLKNQAFVYFPTDYREAANKRDRLVVHRGNTVEHTLAVVHGTGNSYRGGMQIVAKGLPRGVTFSCPPLKPGQTHTQATLTAAPDAEPWVGLIDFDLVPTEATVDFSGSYVYNVPSTQRRGGYSVVFNRSRKCALAVVEEAPFNVTVSQPELGLAQNAMIDLKVSLQRHRNFNEAVRVFAAWVPPGVTYAPPLVIPPGETTGLYRLEASNKVAPGAYPITLTAQQHEGGNRGWGTGFHFVASPPIDLNVVEPYLELKLARTAIERQKDGLIHADIRTIKQLPGHAIAKLIRLPRGVELINPVTIKPGDTKVSFPVRVTKDCLIGQYKEIGCEVSLTDRGQVIRQQTGSGTLRVDAERGGSSGGEEGGGEE